MKKILCPVDLSTNSMQAVQVAASMAKVDEGELVFLYVALPELPAAAGYAIEEYEAKVAEDEEELKKIRPLEDVPFRHEMVRGQPLDEIVAYAKENEIDLIVMTTHGRSGLTRMLLGSVAEHVIRHAPCPVLTLKPHSAVPA